MLPQGSLPINPSYFAAITARLNGVASCEQLQAATDEVMASLGAMKDAMTSELAEIEPVLALLASPASNPAAIVTWISNFITHFLTPYTLPVAVYATQLAELATQVATLADVIASKQAEFPSCSITVPTI